MTLDETELAARRIAAAATAAVCPFCGRTLAQHGGTYAKPAEATPAKAIQPAQTRRQRDTGRT